MNLLLKNVTPYLLLPIMAFGMASCAFYDLLGECEQDKITEINPMVTLSISPLTTRGESGNNVTERISTLRIIMLTETNGKEYVETNKIIDFSGAYGAPDENITGELASTFNYVYTKLTVPGKKKFYLIGNEASVSSISFIESANLTIPESLTSTSSLSDLLQYYAEEYIPGYDNISQSVGVNDPNKPHTSLGKEFETLINATYFAPEYGIKSNGDIFIPYTAYYGEYEIESKDMEHEGNHIIENMYLVPVATKFDMNFINLRSTDVVITDVEISKINRHNYRLAQLDDEEKTKILYEEPVYWIDWLAELTKQSGSASNLVDFNASWGWIKDYYMPVTSNDELQVKHFNPGGNNALCTVPALVDKNNPSKVSLSTFYFPESKNMEIVESDDDRPIENEQKYYIQISGYQAGTEQGAPTGFVEIGNLESLFRATHIVITFTMLENGVDVYAEMAPWDTVKFQGYVEEEED